jgi:hypothetical protein
MPPFATIVTCASASIPVLKERSNLLRHVERLVPTGRGHFLTLDNGSPTALDK